MLRRLLHFSQEFSHWKLSSLTSSPHSSSIAFSGIFTRNFQAVSRTSLFTLLPVILQLILLLGRSRNIFIHKLKHLGTCPTTVPSFITAMAFLSSTSLGSCLHSRHSSITGVHISWYTWKPRTWDLLEVYFSVLLSPMLFFSSFRINICTVSVQSQKHHKKSLTYWSSNEFCYFNFLFLEIKKVTPDNKCWLNLIMYWTTSVLHVQ